MRKFGGATTLGLSRTENVLEQFQRGERIPNHRRTGENNREPETQRPKDGSGMNC